MVLTNTASNSLDAGVCCQDGGCRRLTSSIEPGEGQHVQRYQSFSQTQKRRLTLFSPIEMKSFPRQSVQKSGDRLKGFRASFLKPEHRATKDRTPFTVFGIGWSLMVPIFAVLGTMPFGPVCFPRKFKLLVEKRRVFDGLSFRLFCRGRSRALCHVLR